MLDAMLVVHHCAELSKAEFCRVPDSPLEPTVWVDDKSALCAWHPLMRGVLRTQETRRKNWDAEAFAESHRVVLEGLADHLVELFEESGTPVSYFSNYPSIVTDLRHKRASFTVAATTQDDADADKEDGQAQRKPPSMDAVLRKGRAKKP